MLKIFLYCFQTYLPKIIVSVKSRDSDQDEFLLYTLGLLLKIRVMLFEETSKPSQTLNLSRFRDQLDRLFKWQLCFEESLAYNTILQSTSLVLVMVSLKSGPFLSSINNKSTYKILLLNVPF